MAAQLLDFPALTAALKTMADEIGTNYGDSLTRNKHDATKALSTAARDTTLHKITVEGDDIVVTFDLPSYWKYVENDTRPHWPPYEAIAKWIEVKPVIPRPGRNGRIPTPKQLNYLIRRKIATEGTTGTHDLEKAVSASLPFWETKIAEALADDLGSLLRQGFALFKGVYGA